MFSALPAFTLIAAPVHTGHTEVGVRIHVRRTGIVHIMDRFDGVIDVACVSVRRWPTRTLTHPLVLGLQKYAHLFGRLLGSEGLFA